MRPRISRLGWRRLVVAFVLGFLVLVGGAYGVLVLVTPKAPPPPRFGQDTTANFAPAIDGSWYAPGCRRLRILGGWLMPGAGPLVGSNDSELAIDQPIDLTGVRTDGKPQAFRVQSARLSIRWQRSSLRIQGTTAGARVDLLLERRPEGC
jgi:hypothetical protein